VPSGAARKTSRPSSVEAGGDDCDARYDSALASAADRAQVDVRRETIGPSDRGRGDPTPDRADGGGESALGLHPNPGRLEEPWASRWPFDDCANTEGPGNPASARAADVVAHIPAGALGRDQRGRFLHDGSMDVARLGDLVVRQNSIRRHCG